MLAKIFIGTLLSISEASNASFDASFDDAGWIRSGDYFYLISQEKMDWFKARQVILFGITVRKMWNFLTGMRVNLMTGMMMKTAFTCKMMALGMMLDVFLMIGMVRYMQSARISIVL